MSIGVCDTQNQLTCTHWEVILCTELLKLLKRLFRKRSARCLLNIGQLPLGDFTVSVILHAHKDTGSCDIPLFFFCVVVAEIPVAAPESSWSEGNVESTHCNLVKAFQII